MDPARNYLVVALTGSIGTGKSAAAGILERLGATIIDADLLAREVVAPGTPGLRSIQERFGAAVILPTGALNRRALGEIVFADEHRRRELESILHPAVRALFLRRLEESIGRLSGIEPPAGERHLIVYVVPLFFESNLTWPMVDYVVVVSARREVALSRIIARDSCSRELAEQKLEAQIPIEQKTARADLVIENNSTLADLEAAVARARQHLAHLPPVAKELCRTPAPG